MGPVEDLRKALQDIVAPDLKALQVEVKEGFASVDKQFVSVEKMAAIRHELLLAELRTAQVITESRHEAILRALDIDKRLESRSAAGGATSHGLSYRLVLSYARSRSLAAA